MTRRRAALAGAAAATAWAALQPLDKRVFGCDYSDVALLGKAVTRSRLWPVAGLAVHAANGALFGLAYRELQARTGYEPRRLALALALAEHAALFPLNAVVDRGIPRAASRACRAAWSRARARSRRRPTATRCSGCCSAALAGLSLRLGLRSAGTSGVGGPRRALAPRRARLFRLRRRPPSAAAARAPSRPARRASRARSRPLDQLERRLAEVVVRGAEIDLELDVLGALLRLRGRLPGRGLCLVEEAHTSEDATSPPRGRVYEKSRAGRSSSQATAQPGREPNRCSHTASTSPGGCSWIVTGPSATTARCASPSPSLDDQRQPRLATEVPQPPALHRGEPECPTEHGEPDRPRLCATASRRGRDDAVRPLGEKRAELGRVHRPLVGPRAAKRAIGAARGSRPGSPRAPQPWRPASAVGCNSGTLDSQPASSTATSDGGVISVARARAAAARAPRSPPASRRAARARARATARRREHERAVGQPRRAAPRGGAAARPSSRSACSRSSIASAFVGPRPSARHSSWKRDVVLAAALARTAGGRPRTPSPRRGRRAPCSGPGCISGVRRRPRNSSRHAIQRLHRVRPADPAVRVVQAAAVAVDEPARRVGDELAERRDTVLQRHPAQRRERSHFVDEQAQGDEQVHAEAALVGDAPRAEREAGDATAARSATGGCTR